MIVLTPSMHFTVYCNEVEGRVYKKHAKRNERSLSNYVAHILRQIHFRGIGKVIFAERVRGPKPFPPLRPKSPARRARHQNVSVS